jgi:hypothetical protein
LQPGFDILPSLKRGDSYEFRRTLRRTDTFGGFLFHRACPKRAEARPLKSRALRPEQRNYCKQNSQSQGLERFLTCEHAESVSQLAVSLTLRELRGFLLGTRVE